MQSNLNLKIVEDVGWEKRPLIWMIHMFIYTVFKLICFMYRQDSVGYCIVGILLPLLSSIVRAGISFDACY